MRQHRINFLSRATLFALSTFLMVWNPFLRAQAYIDSTHVGRKISSIFINGNEKTRSAIILREMKHQEGDTLDPHLLEADQKRIQGLNLFNRVEIYTEPEEEKVRLNIRVSEQWYIFPYPVIFINDRDWSKLSYGAGLMHLNFRGRAEILNGIFWLGYDPLVQLDYTNPWVGGRHHLSLGTNLFYQKKRSKHYENKKVNENHFGFKWSLGKRLGHHTHVSLRLGYREITFSPSIPGQTLSADGRDHLPSLDLFLTLDYRDLREYPHRGWYASFSALKTGFPSLTADYFRYGCDLRKYFPIGRSPTLALRTTFFLSRGKIPIYDRVYLGYDERVRGHFYETYEGENWALASVAFRFPLLPIRYFDLADLPQMQNLKFGLSMGCFVDTGVTWFQDEKLKRSMFHSGYGFGLHVHLPYIQLLRFELAFDENRRKQFIVDLWVDI